MDLEFILRNTKKNLELKIKLAEKLFLEDGKTIKDISNTLSISSCFLSRELKKLGLNTRKGLGNNKKYNIDEKYFDNIDTQDKSYILGFLYADGYIGGKNKIITMSLNENDKEILDKINKSIGSNRSLYYKKPQKNRYSNIGSYSLNLQNIYMYNTFFEKDYLNRNKLPKIPHSLMHHFIRGLFDGDGCISLYVHNMDKYNSIKGTFYIMFNNDNIANLIQDYIIINTGVKKTKILKRFGSGNNPVFIIQWSGIHNIINIRNFLYNEANLFLTRKKEKFFQIQSFYSRPK